MPNLDDVLKDKKEKKKFVKKEYRAWNVDTLVNTDNINDQRVENDQTVGGSKPILQEDVEPSRKETSQVNAAADIRQPQEREINYAAYEKLNPKEEIFILSGLQKELFKYILNKVDTETFYTNAMISNELKESLSTSLATIKNAIVKLEKKGLIESFSKRGRGGFYKFKLDPHLYNIARKHLDV